MVDRDREPLRHTGIPVPASKPYSILILWRRGGLCLCLCLFIISDRDTGQKPTVHTVQNYSAISLVRILREDSLRRIRVKLLTTWHITIRRTFFSTSNGYVPQSHTHASSIRTESNTSGASTIHSQDLAHISSCNLNQNNFFHILHLLALEELQEKDRQNVSILRIQTISCERYVFEVPMDFSSVSSDAFEAFFREVWIFYILCMRLRNLWSGGSQDPPY